MYRGPDFESLPFGANAHRVRDPAVLSPRAAVDGPRVRPYLYAAHCYDSMLQVSSPPMRGGACCDMPTRTVSSLDLEQHAPSTAHAAQGSNSVIFDITV